MEKDKSMMDGHYTKQKEKVVAKSKYISKRGREIMLAWMDKRNQRLKLVAPL